MSSYAAFIPPKAKRVVEFGCGQGITGAEFCRIQPACHYVGIDTDERALGQAASCLGQVAQESFSDMRFDRHGIRALDCLVYHSDFVGAADFSRALALHEKELVQDGQVVFILENTGYFRNVMELWQGKAPTTSTVLTLPDVLKAMENCGLRIDNVQPQYDHRDDELKNGTEVRHLIQAFVSYCQAQAISVKTDLWAKRFIIRASKLVKEPPKMLIQTLIGEQAACARVRVHEPHAFCRTIHGVHTDDRSGKTYLVDDKTYKERIMIRQRVRIVKMADLMDTETVVRAGYALLYEMDDYPLRWDSYPKTFFADMCCCHAIQVSTEPLAEFMRQYNPLVKVFQNHLRCLPLPRNYSGNGSVTLLFAALNRQQDWQDIMPVLNDVLHKYGRKLNVKVMFDEAFFNRLETEHKEFIGKEYFGNFAPYSVYEQAMHSSDIALLPLHDTTFNRMKSDLKFIECGGHGAVALASPTVYENTMRHGHTGLIYHNPKEFREYLIQLIEDDVLRHEIAANAYRYVKENRLLAGHYEERYRFYQSVVEQLPQLNRELADRFAGMKEKFAAAGL